MARDSNGTYTRVNNSYTAPTTGVSISSVHADAFFDELEAEMTDSLSRTGKGGMSADLDMNNNDINEIKTAVFQGSTSGNTTVIATAIAGITTLTLPAATDTLVGKATTDTLTNKTIDTAGTNTIKVNGNTLAASAGTATVTLPNSTDTLVGRATTDTLTNKTLTSPVIGGHATIEGVTPTGATGTGNLVFSATPTFTGTLNGAAAAFSGTMTFGTGTFTALTLDASPDASNDLLMSYDASAGAFKKVTIGTVAAAATAGVARWVAGQAR